MNDEFVQLGNDHDSPDRAAGPSGPAGPDRACPVPGTDQACAAPGIGSAVAGPTPDIAVSAVATMTLTPTPIARSSTSNSGWWMSKSWPEPGFLVPSLDSAPGIDSRYQAKSSPPRLCGVATTESAPSTRSAAASTMAVDMASFTVGGTFRT